MEGPKKRLSTEPEKKGSAGTVNQEQGLRPVAKVYGYLTGSLTKKPMSLSVAHVLRLWLARRNIGPLFVAQAIISRIERY
jgi:hypothetical protein